MNHRNLQWKVLVVLISTYISLVNANPIVDGDTIRWTEPGWYQVQSADTLESICEGGTHCEVPGGSYIVINHTSGCLLYTSPSPRDKRQSRMPSSA